VESRKGISLFVLLITSSLLLLAGLSPGSAQPLQPHAPILIPSDSDFTPANGVNITEGGTGLPGNPYIIENWEITANTTAGIHISNTQSFFVIRNLLIHPANFTRESSGIQLDNVANGRVENVRIANFAYGIKLSGSQDIIETSATWNNTYGIVTTGSDNLLSGNQIYNNTLYGMWVTGSTANRIIGNNASNNGNGVCEAIVNPCDGEGFVVAASSNNVFANNTALGNSYYGFRTLFDSTGNIFRNNNV